MAKSLVLLLVVLLVRTSMCHEHDCSKIDTRFSGENCGNCKILSIDLVIGTKTCKECNDGYGRFGPRKTSEFGEPDKNCISNGAIAGIVLGILAVVGLAIFGVVMCLKDIEKKNASVAPAESK